MCAAVILQCKQDAGTFFLYAGGTNMFFALKVLQSLLEILSSFNISLIIGAECHIFLCFLCPSVTRDCTPY